MLKLRKDARNSDVNIVVKVSQGYFTQQLRIAFAIALAIHLTLLFGFHFTTLRFNYPESPSLPTTVTAAPPTPQGATIASTESVAELDKRIPIPPEPTPSFGSVFDVNPPRQQETTKIAGATSNPFQEEENSLLMPGLLSQKRTQSAPIRLVISGDLHNRLVADGAAKAALPKMPQKAKDMESARVVFSVAVDKDGVVCWHEAIEKSSVGSLDVLAEKILATLQFAPSKENIFSKGTVEVHYRLTPTGGTP